MQSIIDQIRAAEGAKVRALAGLHSELGYSSPQELAAAILQAAAPHGAMRARSTATPARPSAKAKKGDTGRRIDAATKKQVQAALQQGIKGPRIAKQYDVSYRTVQNWKAELGLTKHRKARKVGKARKA